MIQSCNSIETVRENIDRIDRSLVALICGREQYIKQAAAFKTSGQSVQAQDRVMQVIEKVRALAVQAGGSADIAEAVYRVA